MVEIKAIVLKTHAKVRLAVATLSDGTDCKVKSLLGRHLSSDVLPDVEQRGFRVDAFRHVVVALVTEDTHNFGG